MTREIVLDTETTGIDPKEGHRIVEIGCVELEGLMPTGRTYHVYINPQRDMPSGAYEVHGLSAEFLSNHPVFSEHVDAFLDFIQDSPLVIHNASFDMRFINAELANLGRKTLPMAQAIDTLAMARQAYPGAQNSLDALCRRFGIDNASRTLHGALLDSELLAEVYLELKGGRQPGFGLDVLAPKPKAKSKAETKAHEALENFVFPRRTYSVPEDESERHRAFLKDVSDPIWAKYGQGAGED